MPKKTPSDAAAVLVVHDEKQALTNNHVLQRVFRKDHSWGAVYLKRLSNRPTEFSRMYIKIISVIENDERYVRT